MRANRKEKKKKKKKKKKERERERDRETERQTERETKLYLCHPSRLDGRVRLHVLYSIAPLKGSAAHV